MIDEFIEWLRAQPADGEIDQGSWECCAVGEFLEFQGIKTVCLDSSVPGSPVYDIDQEGQSLGAASNFLGSMTYGAMLHELTSHHR